MQWTDRVERRIKLRDLHILLALVESGSMGRAAKRLAISQPVVSKTIADLEHALGVRLLDRTSQGVEATVYGRALLDCGTAVFDDLRQGMQEIAFLSGEHQDPWGARRRVGREAVTWLDETTAEAAGRGRTFLGWRRERRRGAAGQSLAGWDQSDGVAARPGAGELLAS